MTMAGFWVGKSLNRSLHFILSFWYTSSGEKRAAGRSKKRALLTGVRREGWVIGGVVELERVNALSLVVKVVSQVHFC